MGREYVKANSRIINGHIKKRNRDQARLITKRKEVKSDGTAHISEGTEIYPRGMQGRLCGSLYLLHTNIFIYTSIHINMHIGLSTGCYSLQRTQRLARRVFSVSARGCSSC